MVRARAHACMLCLPVEFHGRNGFAFAHRSHRGCLYRGKRARPRRGSCGCSCGGRVRGGGSHGHFERRHGACDAHRKRCVCSGCRLGGFGVRMYHAYMEETRRRLAEAERTREELAARRVADERVRIAREVHDITAHSLSAVTIQAAAAERLIDLNPAAAKEAIADIRSVSKSSLDEIRSLIGVLRGDEAAEHAPAEGTERMGDVVSFLQRAGIEVDFDESDYDKAQVPAFVDMALFSLARESATNAVRHAPCRAYLH